MFWMASQGALPGGGAAVGQSNSDITHTHACTSASGSAPFRPGLTSTGPESAPTGPDSTSNRPDSASTGPHSSPAAPVARSPCDSEPVRTRANPREALRTGATRCERQPTPTKRCESGRGLREILTGLFEEGRKTSFFRLLAPLPRCVCACAGICRHLQSPVGYSTCPGVADSRAG